MQNKLDAIFSSTMLIAIIMLVSNYPYIALAQQPKEDSVSPQLQINQPENRAKNHDRPSGGDDKYRSIDGSGNNRDDAEIGAAFTDLLRLVDSDYGDSISSLAGEGRPSPRAIGNSVSAQEGSIPNTLGASDYLWQWGQFLDHDIDLTDGTDPPEFTDIVVPQGDPFFDPDGTGAQVIPFNRSIYNESTGTGVDNPRQQLNEISAWIDASNVYGSDEERANALRTNDGTGKLKTSEGDLLPFNTDGLPNAGGPSPDLFLAGDVRANEQVGIQRCTHSL